MHRLREQIFGQTTIQEGQNHCAQRAHAAAFSRRSDADENCTQHQEDQRQRRYQHQHDFFGHARYQTQLELLVGQCDRISQHHANDARIDSDFIAGQFGFGRQIELGKGPGHANAYAQQHHQRWQAGRTIVFAQIACFRWQCRQRCRLDHRDHQNIDRIHCSQRKAGDERRLVHVTD